MRGVSIISFRIKGERKEPITNKVQDENYESIS